MRTAPPPGFDAERFLASIYWHQGWDIFPGVRTPGPSGVETIMERVGLPKDLTGKRVLDIGAWNGCASFECERRGASEVVALSLEDSSSGFDQLKDLLESERSRFISGSIYNLDPNELGKFDIVLCFGVIYHLRYPVLGIDNLRRVARGALFVESHVLDNCLLGEGGSRNRIYRLSGLHRWLARLSLIQFHKGDELYGDTSNWFSPSMSALAGLLETAGFTIDTMRAVGDRGHFGCRVTRGLPPFLLNSYEGERYSEGRLDRLLGPRKDWDV